MANQNDTTENLLLLVGMRHTNLMEFWADLMNETKGQITGWLVDTGCEDLSELEEYLKPNQIAKI